MANSLISQLNGQEELSLSNEFRTISLEAKTFYCFTPSSVFTQSACAQQAEYWAILFLTQY